MDDDKADLETVNSLLRTWTKEQSRENYNPVPVLDNLLIIIKPKMISYMNQNPYLIRLNCTNFTKNDILIRILKNLHKRKKFVTTLMNDYLQNNYGVAIGLSTQDNNKLQLTAYHLALAYTIYVTVNPEKNNTKNLSPLLFSCLKKYDGDIYYYSIVIISITIKDNDELIEKFLNQIDKMICSVLSRLAEMIKTRFTESIVNETNDNQHNLQENRMDLANNLKFLTHSLDMIQRKPKIVNLYITKYNVETIFFEFFQCITDHKIDFKYEDIFFHWILSYCGENELCLKFMEAGGLKRILQLPSDKLNELKIPLFFSIFLSTEEKMRFICQQDEEIINSLISYSLPLITDEDAPDIKSFYKYAFTSELLVRKFDEYCGLQNINIILSSCINKLNAEDYTDDDEYSAHEKAFYNILDLMDTVKQYAVIHLLLSVRQHRPDQCSLSMFDLFKISDDEIADMTVLLRCLGQRHLFNATNELKSPDFWPQCRKLIHLLTDIINITKNYNFESRTYGPDSTPDSIIRNALYILNIFTVNLEIVDAICSNIKGTWVSEGIECISECCNSIQSTGYYVLNNCLWVSIYNFHVDNNCIDNIQSASRIYNNHELFNKLLNMLKCCLDIRKMLNDITSRTWGTKFEVYLQILIALSFDDDSKKAIIYQFAKFLKDDFFKPFIPSEENAELRLYRKYLIDFDKLVSEERIKNSPDNTNCSTSKNIIKKLHNRHLQSADTESYTDFIYGKLKKTKSIRIIYNGYADENSYYPCGVDFGTACQYSPCGRKMYVGTKEGKIKIFDILTQQEEATYDTDHGFMMDMRFNKHGNLLLINSPWIGKSFTLAKINNGVTGTIFQTHKHDYAEFSKLDDKLIASSKNSVLIYDLNTEVELMKLQSSIAHRFNGKATFSIYDELVLSNSMMWDVKSGKEVYKFPKLSKRDDGIFHPNGTEIIFNHCIWDLRNCHITNIAPSLASMPSIVFSHNNNIIYGYDPENDNNDGYFEVINSRNYTSLIKPSDRDSPEIFITCLASSPFDTGIAVVENESWQDIWEDPFEINSNIHFYDFGMTESHNLD